MKFTWTDKNGFKHCAIARAGDTLEEAKKIGVPCDPPDINTLNWEEIKRDLHNALLERGLVTWYDLESAPNGVIGSVLNAVMKRRVANLYRQTRERK